MADARVAPDLVASADVTDEDVPADPEDAGAADAAIEAPVSVLDAAVDAFADVAMPDSFLPADVAPDAALPAVPVTGLLGYWRFDDADGARIIRDSSGQNHDGAFEGSSTGTGFIAGKFGRAFEMAAPDRNFGIRVPATSAIRGLQRYTLAAWLFRRRTAPNDFCGIISRQIDGKDAEVFNMMIAKDYLKAYGPDRDPATGRVTTASTPTTAPLGVWFHAAATFDGTRFRIYQDGIEQGFDVGPTALPSNGSAPMYLGTKKVINWAHPFIGALDEVLLYDRALPPEAIMALALGQRPSVP